MHQCIISSRYPATALCAIVLLTFSTLAGCGGPADGPGEATDEINLSGLVSSVAGLAGNPDPAQFESLFAAGAAPQDREPYRSLSLMCDASSVDFDGEEATATVTVEDMNEKVLGEVQWSFVKEGEEWKIKTARLP